MINFNCWATYSDINNYPKQGANQTTGLKRSLSNKDSDFLACQTQNPHKRLLLPPLLLFLPAAFIALCCCCLDGRSHKPWQHTHS